MATTIQSGRPNSPKLTADVASRAEVYGGRGLVFDAVSDYLNVSNISFTGEFTISCWFKADDLSSGRPIVGDTGNSHWFKIADTDTVALNVNGSNTEWDSGAVFSTGVWTFISVVRDSDNKIIIYKDGIGYTSNQPTKSGTFTTNAIGQKGNSQYFDGTISDVKFYSSALSESDIRSQYLKPESVPSSSTLVAWYPMSEANPESPQSIVYDHSEKKLGTNLVTNSTFDSDISGWSQNNSDSERTIAHATVDGRTCIEINDQSSSRFVARFDLGANSVDGELYKISYYARKSQTDSTNKYYAVGIGVQYLAINGGTFKSVAEWDTWEFHELYYVAGTSSNFLEFMSATTESGGNNAFFGKLFLDDVKVQKVLMGNHATTNFFGDELKTNNDFTSGSSNWTFETGITATNNLARYTNVGNNLSAYNNSFDVGNGKFIKLEVKISNYSSGSGRLDVNGVQLAFSGNGTHTTTGTTTSNTQILLISTQAGSSFDAEYVSVKYAGISSTGFATAQNEPTIPQIPLVKYNEKAIFYRNKNNYVSLTEQTLGANTAFTISFSFTPFADQEHHMIGKNSTDDSIRIDTAPAYGSRVHVRINGSGTNFTGLGNVNVNESAFYIITRTTGGVFSVYRNGVKSSTSLTSTADFKYQYLGQSLDNSWESDGLLDEFSIFNTHFSDSQAQELFNDGVALDATTHSKSGNLLGYWRNDGVTQWIDRSTNSNHGTVAGSPDSITIREGLNSNKDGLGFPLTNSSSNVVRLNGSSEYVNLGVVNTDIWKSSFTISFWVKPSDGQPSAGLQVMGVDDATGDDSRIFISHTTAGKFYLRYEAEGTIKDLTMNSAIYDDGQVGWKHLTFVIDVNNDNGYIYVNDGVIASNGNGLYSGVDTSGTSIENDFYIGAENRSGSSYFKGLIDEVRIYNKALSATEISKNYKHQKGKHKND